jgi:hypothetical protein
MVWLVNFEVAKILDFAGGHWAGGFSLIYPSLEKIDP